MAGPATTQQVLTSDKVQGVQTWLESIIKSTSSSGMQLVMSEFIFNLALGAILSYFLGRLYVRYGRSLSDRGSLARQFIMLTLITMLIISIVKSSLALSLGLVGALSIVRFRAAIKEPEELIYLFFAIGIGLGLGADLWQYTVVAFIFIAAVVCFRGRHHKKSGQQNLFVTVRSRQHNGVTLKQIVETLGQTCGGMDMKRFDETEDLMEAVFQVEYTSFNQMDQSRLALQQLGQGIRVAFLDQQGLLS